jgi:glycyl-tRNA synthetase alpha subunit
MYRLRKKAAGLVVDRDIRVGNGWIRVTSKSGNTFNVWMNGKEVDCFTDFSDSTPGLKVSRWLADQTEFNY